MSSYVDSKTWSNYKDTAAYKTAARERKPFKKALAKRKKVEEMIAKSQARTNAAVAKEDRRS